MSIATAIQNAQGKVAGAYTAVSNKGGFLPATQNLNNLPTAINSIMIGKNSVTFSASNDASSSSGSGITTSTTITNPSVDILNFRNSYTGDLNTTYYFVAYQRGYGSGPYTVTTVFTMNFS